MEKIIESVPQERINEYDLIRKYFGDRKVCMFDIETTGLSPLKSFTYIIGINVYEDGEWKIIQLFNDDGRSEPEMIRTFQAMLKDYDVLVEFNGDTFDIPYIRKRMSFIESKFHISLTDNFDNIESFDLMKLIRPCKFALGLPNIKQKTIEKYLGIDRVDMYSGGQLIDVYLGYLASQDDRSRELVLRHNRDDMEGMLYLSAILAIDMIRPENISIIDISTIQQHASDRLILVIKCKLNYMFIKAVITTAYGFDIDIRDDKLIFKAPIYVGELKHYLGKSEKDGYLEGEGYFVSQLDKELSGVLKYQEKRRDKESYIMLNDGFLGNQKSIIEYISIVTDKIIRFRKK